MRPRLWLTTLALALTGCATRISGPEGRVLVGGVYDYTAVFLEGSQTIFHGVLRLNDGSNGDAGGSYRLPGQCLSTATVPASAADCVGSITGSVTADRAVTLDFDTPRFHHSGVVGVDGTITGLWTLTFPPDSTGLVQQISGSFRAVPAR